MLCNPHVEGTILVHGAREFDESDLFKQLDLNIARKIRQADMAHHAQLGADGVKHGVQDGRCAGASEQALAHGLVHDHRRLRLWRRNHRRLRGAATQQVSGPSATTV